jgi:hypothetical protein
LFLNLGFRRSPNGYNNNNECSYICAFKNLDALTSIFYNYIILFTAMYFIPMSKIYRDYFMKSARVRFLFTSCEVL